MCLCVYIGWMPIWGIRSKLQFSSKQYNENVNIQMLVFNSTCLYLYSMVQFKPATNITNAALNTSQSWYISSTLWNDTQRISSKRKPSWWLRSWGSFYTEECMDCGLMPLAVPRGTYRGWAARRASRRNLGNINVLSGETYGSNSGHWVRHNERILLATQGTTACVTIN